MEDKDKIYERNRESMFKMVCEDIGCALQVQILPNRLIISGRSGSLTFCNINKENYKKVLEQVFALIKETIGKEEITVRIGR